MVAVVIAGQAVDDAAQASASVASAPRPSVEGLREGGSASSDAGSAPRAYPCRIVVVSATGTAPIAQVNVATGEVLFLHGDSIGSTRSVTDALGAVVAEFDYSLYGTVATVSGDAGATRFLFAGEYLDPSGDYYLRNRVYDPASASFLSVDPALAATGMPFAYTPGNPLQMTDPLGLYSWDDFTDDVGGAAGAVWDEVSSPEFIASMAVGIGCTILTGGTAIVGCAALAGGVYNATAYLANTPPECMTVQGFFLTTVEGALVGAATGYVFGPGGSRVVGAVRSGLNKIAPAFLRRSVSSVLGSGSPLLGQFATSVQQRVGNLATRFETGLASDAGSIQVGRATLSRPSSKVLGANLEAAGVARPAGSAAHHIVAGSSANAARARTVLERFGIGINDAGNGVFLPGRTISPNPIGAAVHSRIHTNAYYGEVDSLLRRATTRDEALDALAYIRSRLLSGGFP